MKNNYSFNPMLKSQFLCFGVFGESLAHLPKSPKFHTTLLHTLSLSHFITKIQHREITHNFFFFSDPNPEIKI